jgi:signal transduction histidine kinase/CheY-like chemotaxis protein
MAEQLDLLDKEELLKELGRLQLENKKISRQLTVANNTMAKLRNTTIAKDNLSAVIAAEKSKQEKHLQIIIDSTPGIFILLDSSGNFILTTQSFLTLTGTPNIGFLHNKSFKQVFSPFSDETWLNRMEAIFVKAILTNTIQVTDEKLDIGGSGNARDYAVSVVPFTYGRALSDGMLVIFNDLTDIIHARDQARAASVAKSGFLATMSHEIRTPMNAIIGMADMLEKTELNDHQKFLSANIRNSSKALLSLVNDILDFSKIEAGKFELVEDFFDVMAMVESIKSVFGVLFTQKNLGFKVNIDPGIPGIIFADENRLKQIITNLLSNSLKYTREGFATLNVYSPEEGFIRFDVEDTGIGIKEDDLDKLFTPFEQFDKVANKNVVGTGLGLPITRRICEFMNGRLDIKSTYGKGSVFSITLPVVAGDASMLKNKQQEFMNFTAPDASVLVVDDIELNLFVAGAMLEEYGMKIALAASGDEAVDLALNSEFDVIFMDHMMPGIDGVITTLELRKRGGYLGSVPIIALTANATVEAQQLFNENGMNDFVAKPIDPLLLNACLYKWLPQDKIIMSGAVEN